MRSFPVYVDFVDFIVACDEHGAVCLLIGAATLPLPGDALSALDSQVEVVADSDPHYVTLSLGADRSPMGMMLKVLSDDIALMRAAIVEAFAVRDRILLEARHA